jgi:hypothetical protein
METHEIMETQETMETHEIMETQETIDYLVQEGNGARRSGIVLSTHQLGGGNKRLYSLDVLLDGLPVLIVHGDGGGLIFVFVTEDSHRHPEPEEDLDLVELEEPPDDNDHDHDE